MELRATVVGKFARTEKAYLLPYLEHLPNPFLVQPAKFLIDLIVVSIKNDP